MCVLIRDYMWYAVGSRECSTVTAGSFWRVPPVDTACRHRKAVCRCSSATKSDDVQFKKHTCDMPASLMVCEQGSRRGTRGPAELKGWCSTGQAAMLMLRLPGAVA